jgi:hypothetical protein
MHAAGDYPSDFPLTISSLMMSAFPVLRRLRIPPLLRFANAKVANFANGTPVAWSQLAILTGLSLAGLQS